jgi:hypothetical protein
MKTLKDYLDVFGIAAETFNSLNNIHSFDPVVVDAATKSIDDYLTGGGRFKSYNELVDKYLIEAKTIKFDMASNPQKYFKVSSTTGTEDKGFFKKLFGGK